MANVRVMRLHVYLIPDKTKRPKKWTKRFLRYEKPKELSIGDDQIWIWKIPFSQNEIEGIQKNFWKRRFFFCWLAFFFWKSNQKAIKKQMMEAVVTKQFGEYFRTDLELRNIYALYYLNQEFQWKKETKWYIICGNLLNGMELLEFITCFLDRANQVYVNGCEVSEMDLDSIWEESGLLVTKTKSMEIMEECDLILDAREGFEIPKKHVPKRGCYVDLTEEESKMRYLRAKSGKIKYISLRNYLDRAFQSGV